jgi:hypothetical protein
VADEQEVLPSKNNGPQHPFGGAVIDLEQTIIGVSLEDTRPRDRIAPSVSLFDDMLRSCVSRRIESRRVFSRP